MHLSIYPSSQIIQTEIPGFNSNQQSLYCGNVSTDLIVQVISSGVRLISSDSLLLLHDFISPQTVTVAVGNQNQIVLALAGGHVLYLEVDIMGRKLIQIASAILDQDIACMSLKTLSPDMGNNGSNSDSSEIMTIEGEGDDEGDNDIKNTILAVGMWTDNSVRFFTPQTLQELTRIQLGRSSLLFILLKSLFVCLLICFVCLFCLIFYHPVAEGTSNLHYIKPHS